MTRQPDQRGAAVADFVLVMVILIPLFLGIVQVGLTLHVRNVLASAASEGARRAALQGGTPAEGQARAEDQIQTALGEKIARRYSWGSATYQGVPAVRLVIEAELPALGFGPAIPLRVAGEAALEPALEATP